MNGERVRVKADIFRQFDGEEGTILFEAICPLFGERGFAVHMDSDTHPSASVCGMFFYKDEVELI